MLRYFRSWFEASAVAGTAAAAGPAATLTVRTVGPVLSGEAQLLRFGWQQYGAPAASSTMIWFSNPQNVNTAVDFIGGLFPGPPPPSLGGSLGGVTSSFVLPSDWYKK
jgi:hypothetical protein